MEDNIRPNAEPSYSPGPLERACYESLRCADYYQPSPRGILHLLAWGILAAALVIFNRALGQFGPQVSGISEARQIFSQLVQAAYSVIQAAALVGGGVFWMDRLRQKPGSLQPGHWILAINSFAIPAILLLFALNSCISHFSIQPFHFIHPIYALLMLLQTLAYGWAAWRLPEYQRWKWGLGLLSLEGLGFSFVYFLISLQLIALASFAGVAMQIHYLFNAMNFFRYFVGAFLVVIMLVDLSRGFRRDWLHWLGVSVPVAVAGITFVGEVAKVFFR
jgi:hypothetical protein